MVGHRVDLFPRLHDFSHRAHGNTQKLHDYGCPLSHISLYLYILFVYFRSQRLLPAVPFVEKPLIQDRGHGPGALAIFCVVMGKYHSGRTLG